MSNAEQNFCLEVRRGISDDLTVITHRLNNHGDRIALLEQHRSKIDVQIDNLIKEISELVRAMKWVMALFTTSVVAVIVYGLQKFLF